MRITMIPTIAPMSQNAATTAASQTHTDTTI